MSTTPDLELEDDPHDRLVLSGAGGRTLHHARLETTRMGNTARTLCGRTMYDVHDFTEVPGLPWPVCLRCEAKCTCTAGHPGGIRENGCPIHTTSAS
jgi:hypothetical protein